MLSFTIANRPAAVLSTAPSDTEASSSNPTIFIFKVADPDAIVPVANSPRE